MSNDPLDLESLLRNLEGAARYDARQGSSRSSRKTREARAQVCEYVHALLLGACGLARKASPIPLFDRSLKCWPDEFQAVLAGIKRCEIRVEDKRRFEVNETILLREWDPSPRRGKYTGRSIRVRVGHIVRGPSWGLRLGTVVLSIFNLRDGEP